MITAARRILVADDSATITTLLTTALTNEGFDVTTAEDGLTTYELGKTGDYDLVIIDQLMPGASSVWKSSNGGTTTSSRCQ
jgi:DNA-binding response OmpR family regulator